MIRGVPENVREILQFNSLHDFDYARLKLFQRFKSKMVKLEKSSHFKSYNNLHFLEKREPVMSLKKLPGPKTHNLWG